MLNSPNGLVLVLLLLLLLLVVVVVVVGGGGGGGGVVTKGTGDPQVSSHSTLAVHLAR